MYFVCLPNAAKTRLVKANILTTKEISDVPAGKTNHNPVVKKVSFLSEYNLRAFHYKYSEFSVLLKSNKNSTFVKLSNPFIESPGKPPNFC